MTITCVILAVSTAPTKYPAGDKIKAHLASLDFIGLAMASPVPPMG